MAEPSQVPFDLLRSSLRHIYLPTCTPAYLKHVAKFLKNNPNDVLTVLFTNPEGLSFADVWAPVFEAANVIQWAYVPPQNPMPYGAWPTLGEMIASDKRLVVFIDYVGTDGSTVDYLLPEFGMVRPSPPPALLARVWLTPALRARSR